MRPWWDGAQWRLDQPPDGVEPAPLAADRWPLVAVPRSVQFARALTFIEAPLLYLAGFVATAARVARPDRLLPDLAVMALVAYVLVAAARLGGLRRSAWLGLLVAQLVVAGTGVPGAFATRIPALAILAAFSAGCVVLLVLPGSRRAIASASTPVPYPDVPRRPRIVPLGAVPRDQAG